VDEKETGRLEAFSDGVFSIAITLLILEFKVPSYDSLPGGLLSEALLKQWPSFFSFTVSFLTILIMWVNHHKLFKLIHKSDHAFLMLNGLLLMLITFVPYPTSVLAQYLRHPQVCTAAALYSGTYFGIALAYNALWLYASHRHRLLGKSVDPARVRAITQQYRYGPIFYGVAFLASLWSYYVSIGMCTALAIFFAIPEKLKAG
jgi:uncharacterized membrane protein